MEHKMILSASGWRKVFAASGNEQDKSPDITEADKALAVIAADVFFDYLSKKSGQNNPVIALGYDTRPTGPQIADAMLHSLVKKDAIVQFSAVTSAPEIMAYAKKLDGFIYISASHNPIGHNGIKFGLNDGGVLNGKENALLVEDFCNRLKDDIAVQKAVDEAYSCSSTMLKSVYDSSESSKHNALHAYKDFINQTICDSDDVNYQKEFYEALETATENKEIGIVCDFNGSSRNYCIDREFFTEHKIHFSSINDNEIVHEIIPEAENLVHVAKYMEFLHKKYPEYILGYMPDCDGDRGNIVYWDEKEQKAVILKAQEVFSLSVLAELTFSIWKNKNTQNNKDFKPAVCVNCPTSMRIEEIVETLGGKVFRAEVGEANVVNCAREKREEGYNVRILGEGSNGGTITYPSAVRDPLNTVFAIIKLLLIRENGLYKLWCDKSGNKYNEDFTLTDILKTLPVYTTTGVSEPRAILKVKTSDNSKLKASFQKVFESEWNIKKDELNAKYGIADYEAIITNGTKETRNISDFSLSGKGGLKILFKDKESKPSAFIWMRGSGTEPVFRIMCDVKGNNPEMEKNLLQWETEMLVKADK